MALDAALHSVKKTFFITLAVGALFLVSLCMTVLYRQSASLVSHAAYSASLAAQGENGFQAAQDYAALHGLEFSAEDLSGNLLYASGERLRAGTKVTLPGWLSPYEFNYSSPQDAEAVGIEIGRMLSAAAQVQTVPLSMVRVGLPLGGYLRIFRNMAFVIFLTAIGLSLITSAVAFSRTHTMLSPIREMSERVRGINVDSLDTRMAVTTQYAEFRELAYTFNKMLDSLQVSYEMQDRFVSDASHELRTPIAVIQGYANLLKRWGAQDPEILSESIDALAGEAENMKELVDKLLFLARADMDKHKTEKEPFSLAELIDEAVRETRMIDEKHVIECERNDVVTVVGDRASIKQALRILIDNAAKYTPEGGKITIDGFAQGGSAVMTVKDTGIGISQEDQALIFDRFFKADTSRSRGSKGAGLGLSIAKWIAQRHGGTIEVYSMVGYGTKMFFTVPLK